MSVLPILLNVTAHFYLIDTVSSGNQPYLSAGKPYIGELYLHSVNDHLLEESVIIADGKARCGIVQRGERVHKASGKTTETAVSETCIGLTLIDILKSISKLLKSRAILLGHSEIADARFERATQKELNAHIVHALCALFVDLVLEVSSLLREYVLHGHSHCLIHLVAGCLSGYNAEVSRKLCFNIFFYLIICVFSCHGNKSSFRFALLNLPC